MQEAQCRREARCGEVVPHLGHVVKADSEDHVVDAVLANDVAISRAVLANGPPHHGLVEHLDGDAPPAEQLLQGPRIGFARGDAESDGDAVTQAGDAADTRLRCDRVRNVAHPVRI